MLFPEVKKLNKKGDFSFSVPINISLKSIYSLNENSVKTVFGEIKEDGNLLLECFLQEELYSLGEEAYSFDIREYEGGLFIKLGAASEKAFIRALFTLKRMCIKNEFILGDITDYPSFNVRGYIEGFYGKPWKSEERLQMLEFMALFGENTHYYAPKDDPYHRDEWKELYSEKEASALLQLVNKAKSLYVDFYYCIAPGLSMQYSSEEDFFALCNKTKQLFSMGITNFGLLLDDIPADLFYEDDKKLYKNAVNAHVDLVKKYYGFLKELSRDCRLTVCPTAYHGKGTEEELVGFAGNIPEEVSVFYTGSDICSKEITSAEANTFFENTRHRPLYWDNYPVNDAEMFMEMHIGPVIGREKDLYKYSAGLISNCMEYFNCNKFPLITVAAYLWNPEEYVPEEAFNEAVRFVLPECETEDFILLSDQFRTSCLHDENSRIMGEYLSRASVCMQTGNFSMALEIITEYTEKINKAAQNIKTRNSPLYNELFRWLKKFYLMSDILTLALEVLSGADKKEELAYLLEQYNESATVLTAFCFREYIESVLNYEN